MGLLVAKNLREALANELLDPEIKKFSGSDGITIIEKGAGYLIFSLEGRLHKSSDRRFKFTGSTDCELVVMDSGKWVKAEYGIRRKA